MENIHDRLFTDNIRSDDVILENIPSTGLKRKISTYEQIVQQASEMGFPPNKIEIALTHTDANSIQDLLNCFIKGENGWEHTFIPKELDENVCTICDDPKPDHIEFLPEPSSASRIEQLEEFKERLSTSMKQYTFDDDIRVCDGETCMICFDPCRDEWRHPDCSEHIFCMQCIVSYLNIRINESMVDGINCPGPECRYLMTDFMIQNLVTVELYDKYAKFKARNSLLKDPSVICCIQPDCEGYMKGSDDMPLAICPICKYEMCFKCRQTWHGTKSCEELMDEGYQEWAKGKEVQLCPRCKRRIEKIEGCNHMNCRMCNYEWCWLCRGRYTSNHYSPFNPFGCSNLQGSNNTRENWPMWRIYLMRFAQILLIVLGIVLFPLVIVFGPSVYFATMFEREQRFRYSRCKLNCLSSLIFISALVLTPLIYAIAIPAGIIGGVVLAYKFVTRNI